MEKLPLILYNPQKRVWEGETNVLELIEYASSQFSILDYELHKKVEGEYFRNRDVYDLSRNRPRLLIAVTLRMIKECTQYTYPDRIGDTIINTIRHYGHIEALISQPYIYPQICTEFLDDMMRIIDQLSPYLVKSIKGFELATYKQYLSNRFSMEFYGNWEKYLVSPKDWFNSCIHSIKDLPYLESDMVQVLNTINRITKKISEEGDGTYEVGTLKKSRGFNSFLHKIRGWF